MDLAAGDVGHRASSKAGERAQDAALGLSAQSEQDEIVPREHGVDDLRDHRVFVTDNAGKNDSRRHRAIAQSDCRAISSFTWRVRRRDSEKAPAAKLAERAGKFIRPGTSPTIRIAGDYTAITGSL